MSKTNESRRRCKRGGAMVRRGPGRERANAIVQSGEPLIAPEPVIAEMANAAWTGTTFHNMSRETATDMVREATRFFSELVPSASLKNRAFAIALELRNPVYDCFYLALAEARNLTVVTADARLLRAAQAPNLPPG